MRVTKLLWCSAMKTTIAEILRVTCLCRGAHAQVIDDGAGSSIVKAKGHWPVAVRKKEVEPLGKVATIDLLERKLDQAGVR